MRHLLAALVIGVLALALTGCGCSGSTDADALARIERTGVLRIGYANEAPFAYLDPTTGEVTGEAPAIIRELAAQLGANRVEGVLTEWGALIPGLQAGRYDVIAAGMYITPERAEQVLFTRPTYSLGEGFLVRTGNPLALHGFADVAGHATARLGVVAGTVEHGYARKLGVPEERIVVFPDNNAAVAGLVADRADALAFTRLTCLDLLARGGERPIELAEPFTDPVIDGVLQRGYGAFAIRRGEERLRDALDAALAAFLDTEAHAALVAPFGFTTEERAGGKTLAEVLAEQRGGG
jgi:polar amino acid transport system substrate-binding protein